MDKKRPEKGSCAVCDPAKGKSTKNGGERFDIWFADMRQRKWDSLQPQCVMPKSTQVRKQNPAAKEEFPTDQIKESCPRQTRQKRRVICFHSSVAASQIINDGSHNEDAKRAISQPQFPVAEGETIFFGIFAEQNQRQQKWDDKVKNQTIPIFVGSEVIVMINDQQQGADNRNGCDFPIYI